MLLGLASALAPALVHGNEPANLGTVVISAFVLGLVATVSLAAGLTGSIVGYVAARLAPKRGATAPIVLAVVGGATGWAVAGSLVWELGSTPAEALQVPVLPTVASAVLLAVVWQLCRRAEEPPPLAD